MTNETAKRSDSAARIIKASASTIYRAFLDPKAVVSWLPPQGMDIRIEAFDPRECGTYRMILTYKGSDHPTGKSSDNSDIVQRRFVELSPNERIVQLVEFESEDPVLSGTMTITWSLSAMPGGTEVTILCENVPEGIRKEDHDAGLRSTLENLAAFTENVQNLA